MHWMHFLFLVHAPFVPYQIGRAITTFLVRSPVMSNRARRDFLFTSIIRRFELTNPFPMGEVEDRWRVAAKQRSLVGCTVGELVIERRERSSYSTFLWSGFDNGISNVGNDKLFAWKKLCEETYQRYIIIIQLLSRKRGEKLFLLGFDIRAHPRVCAIAFIFLFLTKHEYSPKVREIKVLRFPEWEKG